MESIIRLLLISFVLLHLAAARAVAENLPPPAFGLLEAAQKGDASAQLEVGKYYWKIASGCPKEGCEWFERSAEKGNAEAQYRYAGCFCGYLSCYPADPKKAFQLLKKASDQGHEKAKRAIRYLDIPEQKELLDKVEDLAEKGDLNAQLWLGDIYASGRGLPHDPDKAVKWLTRAAERNSTAAALRLARCYAGGPCQHSIEQSVHWYRKAASLGSPIATATLGTFYSNGSGLPQDYGLAIEYLKKAIAQDRWRLITDAPDIAAIYEGLGDWEQAYIWRSIAATEESQILPKTAQRSPLSRDEAATHLTSATLLRAQKQARELYESMGPRTEPRESAIELIPPEPPFKELEIPIEDLAIHLDD